LWRPLWSNTGECRRFSKAVINDKKGFGFIVDPAVDGDIFVHFSEILPMKGRRLLKEGEKVEYELFKDQMGSHAKNAIRV
jgi:cold shock CspA family protein